ncbi:T9SS type A sorting domain-containing protein [Aequorivita sp. Q41]|uniref:T9SS type A sorting domain-containing protein n=1 Tax=Aequorivita sp. Q41 TaxID=3153300 RepID=UPI00324250CF
MKNIALFVFLATITIHAQDYPPAAGQQGSTAIPAASVSFRSWATNIEITRGYVDISQPDFEANGSNFATYGEPENALGPANNTAISLGDAGEVILTFETPIANGPGYDFAVFENSFSDTYLELAFVEVSSNGIDFFRFPAHSQTQTATQVGGFGELDPTYLNNFAGKYRALFGTPFDISEVENDPFLNKNRITHVKIIDVVGSLDARFSRFDSFGNPINDPFTTPFNSSGFDLDAVGVINEQLLGLDEKENFNISIYPNPVSNKLFIEIEESSSVSVYDMRGSLVISEVVNDKGSIDVSVLANGIYLLRININEEIFQRKFLKN